MNEAVTIADDAKPRLPRGVRIKHDEARGEWLLLAPERVIKPDPIALAVLQRCTGLATYAEIIDDLAKAYAAPRDRIEADVRKLLGTLITKRMVDV
jgi:pyrroloquinoline quinone biosynthesis protein D